MAAELTQQYTPLIETLTLIPSKNGCFEVKVNDTLIYSKLATHRHAEEGEVARLLEEQIGIQAASSA